MSKSPLPRSVRPWPCIILAIDPGKLAGWALFTCGKLVLSGTARTAPERAAVIELVRVARASSEGLELIVVAEKWSPAGRGKKKGAAFSLGSLAGLGAAFGSWTEQLEMAEIDVRATVRVLPRTWQARVLGVGRQPPRDVVTKMAVRMSERIGRANADTDEAHAICIGAWAIVAGEVGVKLTLTYLERHGFDTSMRRARDAHEQALKKGRAAAGGKGA